MKPGVLARCGLVASSLLFAVARGALAAGPALGPGAIAASVRDPGGRPIAGAIILAEGPTLRRSITGSAGIATLQALPIGVYDVRITRAGYEPYGRQVAIAVGGAVPTILDVRIALAAFANVRDVAVPLATPALGVGGDPYVAHALSAAPGVDIVPLPQGAGSAPALAGTNGGQTRVELDGIPVAGGAAAFAALRFRNALTLDDVALVEPPVSSASTVRDAVGGIVDYRTPSIGRSGAGALDFGYDSEFGAFQHARFTRTFGKVGILSDAVTGGGENRSQTLKAQYSLSTATSLGFAAYGSQSSAPIAGESVTSTAPASAVDLRTMLGSGTLTARRFESVSRTSTEPLALAAPHEDARIVGVQARFDIPQGRNLLSVGFDRRSESELAPGVPPLRSTFSALSLLAKLQLSRASSFEIGDLYSGGTQLAPRNDPHAALAFAAGDRVTLRLAAGSAYATRPSGLDAAAAAIAASGGPETSFGYRLGVDAALGSEEHAWFSAFTLRRRNAFANLSEARALGVQLGIERAATASRFGGTAFLDLVRSDAFGGPQTPQRALGTFPATPGAQLEAVPYSKARLALTYRANSSELRLGATLLGANNALAANSLALGDASLAFPFARVVRLRIAIQNMFGAPVTDPALRAFYAPREFTLVVGPDFTK